MVLEFLARATRQEEEIKGIQTGQEIDNPYSQKTLSYTLKTPKTVPKNS
jgi:hypothetical protein